MEQTKGTVTRDQVKHAAKLARLELTDEELALYTDQLDAILGYVAQLSALDLGDVAGTAHAVDLSCPQRTDEVRTSVEREQILGQAADRDEEYFVVPPIIE
jgi:aspartyl-tRNA(Asn)/glutamyl-tRNA(Gln) amidotransferase subunit C